MRNAVILHPLLGFVWLRKDYPEIPRKLIQAQYGGQPNHVFVPGSKFSLENGDKLRSEGFLPVSSSPLSVMFGNRNALIDAANSWSSAIDRRSVGSMEELRRLKEQLNQLQGVSRSQLIKKINEYFRRPEFAEELRSSPKLGKEFFG